MLFERFYRGDLARGRVSRSGVSLGLSLAEGFYAHREESPRSRNRRALPIFQFRLNIYLQGHVGLHQTGITWSKVVMEWIYWELKLYLSYQMI